MQEAPSQPHLPPTPLSPTNGVDQQSSTDAGNPGSTLYELKEQLLLLTTLVATVTYVSGLNLPGGAWDESQDQDGRLAGDSILRVTDYRRYLAFYYCNATALASSLVVCLILVMLRKKSKVWTVVLRGAMVLDLLGIMGSYAAGSCRDNFTAIWASLLACPILAYLIYALVCYLRLRRRDDDVADNTNLGLPEDEKIEVLMLLATFVVTIAYAAGLNPPGGYWNSTTGVQDQQHLAGDPIMQERGPRRHRAFFVCNTTAFAASLLIILLLLDKKLSRTISRRFTAVYVFIAVALLGLMGAYAAGSCREVDNTVKVLSLAAAVPACVGLQLVVAYLIRCERVQKIILENGIKVMRDAVSEWFKSFSTADKDPDLKNTRYFVMVLASLAVSITYQAGLDPPGGLWQDDLGGHKVGHPVLQTRHPARYKVFFYSNSAAFVTSLVVVMMVQSRFLLRRRTLLAAMVLDLIGLVIAYAAGSTRDASTSIYVVAMACLVLSYVVIHIALGGEKEKNDPPNPVAVDAPPNPAIVAAPTTPTPHDDADAIVVVLVAPPSTPAPPAPSPAGRTKEQLEDKRQVLLLIAILVATVTYQAGLTPPGGFWPADDELLGHRAGYPVLLDNYPRRYKAFFYCNAASFMASVALILLLVNRKLYRPGIRCYALHVCMAVGMFALMGAYASGSSRHLKTSIYVLTLVAAVSASILLQAVIFWYIRKRNQCKRKRNGDRTDGTITLDPTKTRRRLLARGQGGTVREQNEELEYLMLLGVLIASVAYQTGLKPPGGNWQEDKTIGGRQYSAGNPILHDISQRRYNVFFYSNSASFMASIIVIVTLLPLTLKDVFQTGLEWPLWPVHTAILMDMLGLLVAYAAGSTRNWESSRNVIFLILPVLAYIVLYAGAAAIYIRNKKSKSQSSSM